MRFRLAGLAKWWKYIWSGLDMRFRLAGLAM